MNKDSLIQLFQSVLPMSTGKAEQLAEKYKTKKIARNEYLLKEGTVAPCNMYLLFLYS